MTFRAPFLRAQCPAVLKPCVLLLGGLAGLALWAWVCAKLTYILWGPYAGVFLASSLTFIGPAVVTMVVGSFFLVVGWPLLRASGDTRAALVRSWFVRQALALGVFFLGLLGAGQYVHNIVAWQGLELSIKLYAGARGDIPAHVREAMLLSERLSREGKAPYLPFAWRDVAWPVTPTK